MKDIVQTTKSFLEKYKLDVRAVDFDAGCEHFISEMSDGLAGGSSLAMVPTFIEETGTIPVGKPVLVLDAGGTNFRAAIVKFNSSGEAEIEKFRKMRMPGVDKEISAAGFYTCLVDFIEDLVPEVDRIGFCFSYAMKKTVDKDGLLIKFSKEVKVPELKGTLIGKGVLDALRLRGHNNIRRIIMLNDTVATQLAGKASGGAEQYDDFIGLIIGTGLNASYNEANDNIKKLGDLPAGGSQIINMESGSYDGAPYGEIDEHFRATTVDPAAYHFEKMISGAYQGPFCFAVMREAASEGLFSAGLSEALSAASGTEAPFTTEDLSRVLSGEDFPAVFSPADASDIETARKLCAAVMERAAFLSAVKISAMIMKIGRGRNPERPVCVCADGSTFWKLTGFKEKIEGYLREYLVPRGYYFEFVGIDNAPVIGAAVAGLTN